MKDEGAWAYDYGGDWRRRGEEDKKLQELRLLSSVTLNCQVTTIVINTGSQLSEMSTISHNLISTEC